MKKSRFLSLLFLFLVVIIEVIKIVEIVVAIVSIADVVGIAQFELQGVEFFFDFNGFEIIGSIEESVENAHNQAILSFYFDSPNANRIHK